jgi:hypothetical protein
MDFEERVARLTETWAHTSVPFVEGIPGNEACAIMVFAAAEIFRRLTTGNAMENWGNIEKEIIRQFAEALHVGIEASRRPFN